MSDEDVVIEYRGKQYTGIARLQALVRFTTTLSAAKCQGTDEGRLVGDLAKSSRRNTLASSSAFRW
jgi:hypothetical protein